MADIVEKIEKLSKPNAEIDAEIAATFRIYTGEFEWVRKWSGEWRAINGLVHLIGDHGSSGNFRPPAYTASLDAAMSLFDGHIPRGLTLTRRSNPDMGGRDWIVSAIGKRAAGRSWPLALCALAIQTLPTLPTRDQGGEA